MGTRHLTEVKVDDTIKVAQYGQWDGYYTGQGKTIADFLKSVDLDKFREQVKALKEYTAQDIEQAYIDAGAEKGAQFVSMDVSDKVKETHPALCRDYGAGILQLIHDGKVTRVHLQSEFKEDTLFCKYAYLLDLDAETVSVGGKTYTFAQWKRKGFMEKLSKAESEE